MYILNFQEHKFLNLLTVINTKYIFLNGLCLFKYKIYIFKWFVFVSEESEKRERERERERGEREREGGEGRKYLRVNVQRTGGLLLSVLSTIMHCDICI